MAAMSWAVEHAQQGPLDAPVDALQLAFQLDAAFPVPAMPPQTPGSPAQTFTLERIPPANWIPMVPVVGPAGARYFRRGILVRPGYGDVHASAQLLEPGHPFFVADETIPRGSRRHPVLPPHSLDRRVDRCLAGAPFPAWPRSWLVGAVLRPRPADPARARLTSGHCPHRLHLRQDPHPHL